MSDPPKRDDSDSNFRMYMYDRDTPDGPISELMRIIMDDNEFYAEEYIDGEWYDSERPFCYMYEPPGYGDHISESEAMEIIASGVLDGVEARRRE